MSRGRAGHCEGAVGRCLRTRSGTRRMGGVCTYNITGEQDAEGKMRRHGQDDDQA